MNKNKIDDRVVIALYKNDKFKVLPLCKLMNKSNWKEKLKRILIPYKYTNSFIEISNFDLFDYDKYELTMTFNSISIEMDELIINETENFRPLDIHRFYDNLIDMWNDFFMITKVITFDEYHLSTLYYNGMDSSIQFIIPSYVILNVYDKKNITCIFNYNLEESLDEISEVDIEYAYDILSNIKDKLNAISETYQSRIILDYESNKYYLDNRNSVYDKLKHTNVGAIIFGSLIFGYWYLVDIDMWNVKLKPNGRFMELITVALISIDNEILIKLKSAPSNYRSSIFNALEETGEIELCIDFELEIACSDIVTMDDLSEYIQYLKFCYCAPELTGVVNGHDPANCDIYLDDEINFKNIYKLCRG